MPLWPLEERHYLISSGPGAGGIVQPCQGNGEGMGGMLSMLYKISPLQHAFLLELLISLAQGWAKHQRVNILGFVGAVFQ